MVSFFLTIGEPTSRGLNQAERLLIAVVDGTITGLVCFKLARAKVDSEVPSTQRLITKLITITFGAAFPPTLALMIAAALTLKPVR